MTKERKVKKRKVVRNEEFPEDIDSRLTSILSTVNAESKQVQLLLMSEYPQISTRIKSNFDHITDNNFDIDHRAHGKYCTETFVPIGFVCEEKVIYDDYGRWLTGWSINGTGEKYGKPIAAFTLRKANEYGKSFHEFLGSTKSAGKSRSPYNRIMMLELLSDSPMSTQGLTDVMDLDSRVIRSHIKKLQELGFLEYDSVSPEEPGWSSYRWVKGEPKDVEQYAYMPTLTTEVSELLSELKESDCETIGKILDYDSTGNISCVLSHLEKYGFAERLSKFKIGEKLSEVIITEEGRNFLDDYSDRVVDALRDGEELEHMRSIQKEYERDTDKFAQEATRGVLLYRGVSPPINSKGIDQCCEEIYKTIKSRNGVRPVDIGRLTGISNTSIYLKMLKDNDLIYAIKDGRAAIYKAK